MPGTGKETEGTDQGVDSSLTIPRRLVHLTGGDPDLAAEALEYGANDFALSTKDGRQVDHRLRRGGLTKKVPGRGR